MTANTTTARTERAPGRAGTTRRARHLAIAREAVLLGALYGIYSLIRNLAPERVSTADAHARSVLRVESGFGFDIELGVNRFVTDHPALAVVANYFYATLFLVSVVSVLVWLWRTRPQQYRYFRTALVLMTLVALASYWAYPVSPPRLLPGGGYVDTVPFFETWGVSAADRPQGVSNQYAAMPSMHVGWALWCGLTVALCTRARWKRVVALAFPAATVFVVIATANHFVLDAVAGVLLCVLALVVCAPWGRRLAARGEGAVAGAVPEELDEELDEELSDLVDEEAGALLDPVAPAVPRREDVAAPASE
ncbi:phosphatase PAP2 family protein [Cellulomonas hominis]